MNSQNVFSFIRHCIERNNDVSKIIIDASPINQNIWLYAQKIAIPLDLQESPNLPSELFRMLVDTLSSNDQVMYAGTGSVTTLLPVDGCGIVTMTLARGPAPSAIVEIDSPVIPDPRIFNIDSHVLENISTTSQGIVIIGGNDNVAVARSLFSAIHENRPHDPAATIDERPLVRRVAKAPMIWVRWDHRIGISRIDDACSYASRFSKLCLISTPSSDPGGLAIGCVNLADAGALVLVAAFGQSIESILERWHASVPAGRRDSAWIALCHHLRAVISISQTLSRFGIPIPISSHLLLDSHISARLAAGGPQAAGAMMGEQNAFARTPQKAEELAREQGIL